jgi:CspA family cold shock protein
MAQKGSGPAVKNLEPDRQRGTVKWFNDVKGFGFITPDLEGPDVFVHYSDIETEGIKGLQQGNRVDYIAEPGLKSPKAKHVRVIRG